MINEVPVYDENITEVSKIQVPHTLTAPQIDHSLIVETFRRVNMRDRQPYAVSKNAGKQHSAEGWGTGRAMARVPRVKGSGTKRAGEGAFANFCRKGRLAHPTKTTRKWHRKTNATERLHAIVSGLKATCNSSLVESRGHLISDVKVLPIVVSDDSITKISKTKEAVNFLSNLGLKNEIERVKKSKNIRCGLGKIRNRRYTKRRGILIIHNMSHETNKSVVRKDNESLRAFKNIPGVEFMRVDQLDLLKICPGGSLGRLVVWSESAFLGLDESVQKMKKEMSKMRFREDNEYYKFRDSLVSDENKDNNVMDLFYSENVQAILENKVYGEMTRNQCPKFILENNQNLLGAFKMEN